MIALFSNPGNVFSPLFADRTPIISQTNTKTSFKAWKAQRPDIIIGVVWACWLCLGSQPWPEETAYRLMVSGVEKKKTMTKVRGQRRLSSPRDSTATSWWLNRRLNSPVSTKMVPLQLRPRFDLFSTANPHRLSSQIYFQVAHMFGKGGTSSKKREKRNNTTVIKSNQSSTSQYENTSVWLQGVTHRVNNGTTNELICYSPSCGEIPHTGQ